MKNKLEKSHNTHIIDDDIFYGKYQIISDIHIIVMRDVKTNEITSEIKIEKSKDLEKYELEQAVGVLIHYVQKFKK